MKKNSYLFRSMLSVIVVCVCFVINNETVFATEGGAAPVKGEITLVGETTEPTDSSTSTEPSGSSGSQSTDVHTPKPKGRFPSTGELVKKSLSISGILLIILVCVLFLIKKKKHTKADNRGNK